MPTYEYSCGACGNVLEKFQSMTAKPLKRCPSCGQHKLVRLIGAGSGILFRGDGWPGQDIARKEAR